MLGLQHDDDSFRIEFLVQQIGNRVRHPLLNLRPARDLFDDASQFAQPRDLAIGQIADVGLADERQQVVLTHAVESDVTHEYQLVVIFREDFLQVPSRLGMQAGEQLSVHSGDSARRIEQSFTVRIFADRRQNFSNSTLDPRQVNRGNLF